MSKISSAPLNQYYTLEYSRYVSLARYEEKRLIIIISVHDDKSRCNQQDGGKQIGGYRVIKDQDPEKDTGDRHDEDERVEAGCSESSEKAVPGNKPKGCCNDRLIDKRKEDFLVNKLKHGSIPDVTFQEKERGTDEYGVEGDLYRMVGSADVFDKNAIYTPDQNGKEDHEITFGDPCCGAQVVIKEECNPRKAQKYSQDFFRGNPVTWNIEVGQDENHKGEKIADQSTVGGCCPAQPLVK